MAKISYNERSWAIDLITEINLYTSKNKKTICRAGGESTINTGTKRLFPDVLLYGTNSEILMGWELKMPDTPITDKELIENAILKAQILWVNSFLLWNVGIAVLYIKKWDGFSPVKTWDSLKEIAIERNEIESIKNDWRNVLHQILKDLNGFFDNGKIEKRTFVESFKDSAIIEFILRNNEMVAENLRGAAKKDSKLSAEINIWWRVAKSEYPKQNQWEVLSKIVLVNWIHKFLFAHILIAFFDPAKKVETIEMKTSVKQAVIIFKEISAECNFWNIFQPQMGELYINEEVWSEIKQFNILLNDIELSHVWQELLQDLLQNIIYSSKRKIAGQFATPQFLARLLVSLTLTNKELSLHDPCCGTWTIARSAYDLKKELGIDSKRALQSIFCSDKVAFPLQMATLALTDPHNIGEVIQIYKEDCTKIQKWSIIELKDPYSGEIVKRPYNGVDYIVSNLPFIQQEDLNELNPWLKEQTEKMVSKYTNEKITFLKSDLYSYLPFYFWDLLKKDGKLGIIISNSWLATEWGVAFREMLNKFYHIEYIIISWRWRWFKNADVITTVVILNKRNSINESVHHENTSFITVNTDIREVKSNDIQEIVDNILVSLPSSQITIQKYNTQDLFHLDINWNALFSDISWVSEIQDKLMFANVLFDINRWERRGWDPMFLPEKNHNIENIYIKPILKSSKEIKRLVTSVKSEAFCCKTTIEELEELQHYWALSWIKKFEHEANEKGKYLPEVLKKSGHYWYEMKDSTMADFVVSMNFNKRIFIAKLQERSFVNQRLTRFTLKDTHLDLDLDLIHALLNSTLGMFFIESIGFWRWLGVLDLSSTRVKKNLKMLNYELLSDQQKNEIKRLFRKLREREILPILQEIESEDRIKFDEVIFKAFWIEKYKNQIIESLKTLYQIRTNINS